MNTTTEAPALSAEKVSDIRARVEILRQKAILEKPESGYQSIVREAKIEFANELLELIDGEATK